MGEPHIGFVLERLDTNPPAEFDVQYEDDSGRWDVLLTWAEYVKLGSPEKLWVDVSALPENAARA